MACNVNNTKPQIARYFPALVSMMKGAAIMQAAPIQEASATIIG